MHDENDDKAKLVANVALRGNYVDQLFGDLYDAHAVKDCMF